MAKNTSLYFRVVEGRNLPAKDVSGTSDPYCIVKVDNEVVARTATVWKNLNPFWGEEYTLHLPMGFHSLSFHVMDEDTIGHDDVIGKITLSKEAIRSQAKGLDSWLNLTRVDPDEEVQGEIHLSLELLKDTERISVRCQIIEARDLAPRDISGTSDPFARVIFNNHSAETSIIKKTRFPHWAETLELELDPEELSDEGNVTVEVWDWDMVGKNDFLGKVEIPFACLHKTPLLEGWFRLLPLGNNEVDAGGKLGALRLKVRLVEDRILPSVYYQPLIDLMVESVISPTEVEDSSALTMLEDVTTVESRQDVAMTLVKIYLGQGLVVPFLDYLNTREVNHTTDPNTLFRSNSLASKAMEQFMKAVGMLYLHEVLKPIINRIFDEKKYIELDPCKIDLNRTRRISFKGAVSEAEVRDSSVEMLQSYLTSIIESIVGSVDQCPPVMRVAFKQLHKRVEEQFAEPANEDVKYLAISGFFFLRFFAPAILTPKLFQLRDQHADTRTSRTLLLLAKALQSVGNLGLQLGHGKEQWMAPLHPIILRSVASVKDLLDKLIDIDHDIVSEVPQRAVFMPSVTVKEGYLHKHKTEGPQLLSRFAFKKRYFWLTSETLSYAKTPDWQVRSSIPIQCVCAVERVDENAFQQQQVMQVITQDTDGQMHTMYIQCKNVNELNQWLSAIRKVSIYNERMLPSFHPGAHRSGKWTCCLQSDRAVTGCSRTHSAVTLGDWSDPLDPDVETQTIYKQLLQGKEKLRKKYVEMPDADQTLSNKEKICSDIRPDGAECVVQLLKPGQSIAVRLLAVIEDLEQAHTTFQCREEQEDTSVILNP
ncbi:putative rasGAP-activating-like protein 1 [Scophthalmus maximus]|uniref:Putative rasGAP-activating-like protein 1 n=1 Tax=Scophthalmus maximus TaxID=52904 RepID=A0A2U9BRG9_SCOMX|nr:rasGAP-activating-like protein 1 isoform X1 [Scophthalmus maximus]AWP06744.1 putative rasGAP-activating-like protein 1 [Scophthalmus maximus]